MSFVLCMFGHSISPSDVHWYASWHSQHMPYLPNAIIWILTFLNIQLASSATIYHKHLFMFSHTCQQFHDVDCQYNIGWCVNLNQRFTKLCQTRIVHNNSIAHFRLEVVTISMCTFKSFSFIKIWYIHSITCPHIQNSCFAWLSLHVQLIWMILCCCHLWLLSVIAHHLELEI